VHDDEPVADDAVGAQLGALERLAGHRLDGIAPQLLHVEVHAPNHT
jgi:hypothetical protein